MTTVEFEVTSIGKGIADVRPDFVLEETGATRLVFRAQIHEGGIRGWVIRQKKNLSENWEDTERIDFRKLKSGEGVHVQLSTESLRLLIDRFDRLSGHLKQHGIVNGRNSYISGLSDEVVVTESNKAHYIRELVQRGYSEEFWNTLIDENPDLAQRIALSKIYEERKVLVEEFERSLGEDRPEEYWQRLLASNRWVFGSAYIGRIGERRISIRSTLDHPLISEDGCLEIVEIKKPSFPFWARKRDGTTFRYRDKYFVPNGELQCAIAQATNYVLEIEKELDSRDWTRDHDRVLPLKPKALIVHGRSHDWGEEEVKAFRLLNDRLHGITIITFDHLLSRARQSLDAFNPDSTSSGPTYE